MATKKDVENQAENQAENQTEILSEQATIPFEYEVVKHVTRTLLKPDFNKPLFIKVESIMEKAAEEKTPRSGKTADMEPPVLMDVIDLVNGVVGMIIVPAVLESELRDKYPEDGYIDRCFRIEKLKLEGKRYSGWNIQEIQLKK